MPIWWNLCSSGSIGKDLVKTREKRPNQRLSGQIEAMDELASLQIIGDQGQFTAKRAWRARRFLERLGGLLVHPQLLSGEALVIEKCNSVHTIFMSYPIDVIFCSAENQVVAIRKNLKPFRIVPPIKNAAYVIELASLAENFPILPGCKVVIQ